MSYYRTCPRCGCNLDPGERCDCGEGRGPDFPAGHSKKEAGVRLTPTFGRKGAHHEGKAYC